MTIKGTSAELLARLFQDNVWKLSESVILDREPQFAVELMKNLNKILEIEIMLLTTSPTDKWANKAYELETRTVSIVFCE